MPPSPDESPHPPAGRWLPVAILVVAAALFAAAQQRLMLFFILDDLPMLAHGSPALGYHFSSAWQPMSNGFWRPVYRMIFYGLETSVGMVPWVYHAVQAGFVAAAAGLTYAAARRLGGPVMACAAAAVVLLNVAPWRCHAQLANCPDALVAMALLGGWMAWDAALRSTSPVGFWKWYGGVLLCWLAGVLLKETIVVLPVLLGVWAWHRRADARRSAVALGILLVLCAAQAFLIMHMQRTSGSYAGEGRMSLAPKLVARQYLDYTLAYVLPFFHVAESPVGHIPLGNGGYWLLRGATLAGMAALAMLWLRRSPRWSEPASLFLMATVTVIPVSVLVDPPQSRFLFPGMPFVALALVRAVQEVWRGGRGRLACGLVAGALAIAHGATWFMSPEIAEFRRACIEVERFVNASRKVSAAWPDGAIIAIYNHPHPGLPQHRWSYCQLLWTLFLPEKKVTVALDQMPPGMFCAYEYVDGTLKEKVK